MSKLTPYKIYSIAADVNGYDTAKPDFNCVSENYKNYYNILTKLEISDIEELELQIIFNHPRFDTEDYYHGSFRAWVEAFAKALFKVKHIDAFNTKMNGYLNE